MGRPRTKDRDLPPRMRRNHGALYHVVDGRWTRLAPEADKATALRKWAEIEGTPPPAATGTVQAVWDLFLTHPKGLRVRAARTQKDYAKDAVRILAVFGKVQVSAIKPEHVRRYLDNRTDKKGNPAPIRATREKALLSLLCTCAREWGIFGGSNPCAGIKGWKAKRNRYITDDEYLAIMAKAPEPLQDAMHIALATGQRPADVRKMLTAHIRDEILWIEQGKTKKRLGVRVEGELKVAIERSKVRAKAAKVSTLHLVTDEAGQPYNAWTLRAHLRKAAKAAGVPDAQLRDLRAKAATDFEDLAKAQELLGHKNRSMTEEYVKERRGQIVSPFAQNKRQ